MFYYAVANGHFLPVTKLVPFWVLQTTRKHEQLVFLLVSFLSSHLPYTGHDVKLDSIDKIAMVASTVSSKFLARMAEVEGFRFEEALTGFKWIGNKAMELEREGYTVVFAFEEAIGFTVGDIVKDKDGVSALAVFSEWAVQLKKRGMTPYQYLESLYAKYGYFVSDNSYFICGDKALIGQIFERIRHFVSGNGCYFQNIVLTIVVIGYVGKQQH